MTRSSAFAEPGPIKVSNPFSGDSIGEVDSYSPQEVGQEVDVAAQHQEQCRTMPRALRADILSSVAARVNAENEDYARIIARESGKPIRQARKEVARCVNTLTLSAEEAKRLAGETIPFDAFEYAGSRQGYYTREPLGVIAGITPFNDPLNLVAHKLGPAIAGGNCFVLKPSELTPFSALRLCAAFRDAGFPEGALRVVTGVAATGAALVSHPRIRMVSFTGGVKTADAIVRAAGVKKFAMDLGGNAPVIILPDCALDKAINACLSGAFWAAGQNCIGTQRILVHRQVYNQFKEQFVDGVERLRAGNPMDESTDIGPMITEAAAQKVENSVNNALRAGARLLAGNRRDGCLYAPTVLENVPDGEEIWREEAFAPVVSLRQVQNLEQALAIANEPEISLHAGIFTDSLSDAFIAADRLQASGVMVNDSSDYRIDAMPFGGFKLGSMGREGVRFAVEEMTQTKVVCVNIRQVNAAAQRT